MHSVVIQLTKSGIILITILVILYGIDIFNMFRKIISECRGIKLYKEPVEIK